jgi:hypothetical protein
MRSFFPSLSALCFLVLAGCAPTVNVATPEPVKIDVNMKVDVNYKEDPNKAKVDPLAQESLAQARRNRTGEVQTLKNDRVIGEARTGYLEIRNLTQKTPTNRPNRWNSSKGNMRSNGATSPIPVSSSKKIPGNGSVNNRFPLPLLFSLFYGHEGLAECGGLDRPACRMLEEGLLRWRALLHKLFQTNSLRCPGKSGMPLAV